MTRNARITPLERPCECSSCKARRDLETRKQAVYLAVVESSFTRKGRQTWRTTETPVCEDHAASFARLHGIEGHQERETLERAIVALNEGEAA